MEFDLKREFRYFLYVYFIFECAGIIFGPYSPYSRHQNQGYGDDHYKHGPFIYKKDVLEHLPYKGFGIKTVHKHKINTTALCELKGGVCAPHTECFGQHTFFCGNYTSTCCFNRTKHVKFSRKLLKKEIINETALCIAKGGVCAGAGECFGTQKFSCEDLAFNCCFNSTRSVLIIKKIFNHHRPQQKFRRKRRRRRKKKKKKRISYRPYVYQTKKRKIQDILYSHFVDH